MRQNVIDVTRFRPPRRRNLRAEAAADVAFDSLSVLELRRWLSGISRVATSTREPALTDMRGEGSTAPATEEGQPADLAFLLGFLLWVRGRWPSSLSP